jgi:hypothetical protein
MEERNGKEIEAAKYEGFTEEEKTSLQSYIKNGCPGLTKVNETMTFEWFELYMSGKTYHEISIISKAKKDLVLFIAHKLKWYDKRMEYLESLSSSMISKTTQSKIESIDTVATMVSALNRYLGDKFVKYLKTKDETHIKDVDTKLLAQYHKSLETLDKLMGGSVKGDSSGNNVIINTGSATVKQIDDKTVSIDTDNDASEILRALAKYKRAKEESSEE